jgi:hypothetical protein
MNSPMIGNQAFKSFGNYKNAESSAVIPVGSPVCFVMNGTEDGYAAVLPSTAGAAKTPELFAGVSVTGPSVAAGVNGQLQVYGLCNYALFAQQTRAASTDSYASAASVAVGAPLQIDTVNNAFAVDSEVTGAMTIVTGATTATVAANFGNGKPPMFVMAQTLASAASAASTSSDATVKKTYGVKIFLRAM